MKLKIVTMGIAALVVGVAILGFCSTATAQEKVNFQMDWIFSGKHTPFFVARDKGFFKKNGLDVNMIKGRGSGWAATSVDTKQTDYSYGDFPTALKAMAKGAKNRAIGVNMVFQGGGLIFLDTSGIKTPKDLEGKRFGASAADFGKVLLPAMAAASGFDDKKVILKIMKPSVRTPAFFQGKIDFISGVRGSSIPRMRIIAGRQGKKVNNLFFKDMGIDTYGHVLQTHAERIKSNPDQVGRFVGAIYDAWAWSIKNPKEAFEIYMKANPERDREIGWAQLQEALSDIQDPETKQYGLGYMKESMVKKSVAIANKYFKLSPAVDYKMTYTNQFIKKNPAM